MDRRAPRSRLPWYLAASVLAAALAYVFYPVRAEVTGMGTVEPVFEDLVVVTPGVSGIVTRVRVKPRQDVDRGTPLFEYLPDGQWAVLIHAGTARPGEPAPSEPEWSRTIDQWRLTRAEALRRWSSRVFSPQERPHMWERRLEQRLNVRVARASDLALDEGRAAENVRLGRAEANLVQVFDRNLGMLRGTEDGQALASDVEGLVYSLWVTQRSQFFREVGEIMKPGTPVEVLGLVPLPPVAVREASGWNASVRAPGGSPMSFPVRTIEFGRIRLDARDGSIIFPNLAVTRDSIFVRLGLTSPPDQQALGNPVVITLTAPARPRLWFWLRGG